MGRIILYKKHVAVKVSALKSSHLDLLYSQK